MSDAQPPTDRDTPHNPGDTPPAGGPAGRVGPWPEVPGYAISGEVARGGMGVVYTARDQSLDREVAIKTILPHLAAPQYAAQFDREARITGRLPHPGVPPVHALGTLADGRPFLAMKLIRGRTLAAELAAADRVPDRPRLLGVFEQVCHAVGFAHAQGIVHRDLKPANVMVGAFGEVQVMDWGIARGPKDEGGRMKDEPAPAGSSSSFIVPPSSFTTSPGQVKGTPAYMAPEQAREQAVDARADVFALGGILCELLTGQPPYTQTNYFAAVRAAGSADLADAFAHLDSCGAEPELVVLCKRCLAPDSADRPADGRAVAEAVAAYRAAVEDRARNAETERAAAAAKAEEATRRADAEERARRAADERAAEQRRRRRAQLALAGAVGLLVAAGGAFAWLNQRAETRRAAADAAKAGAEADKLRAEAEAERQAGLVRDRVAAARADIAGQFGQARTALVAGLADLAAGPLDNAEQRIAEGGADDFRGRLAVARADLAVLRQLDQIDDDRWTITDRRLTPHEVTTGRLGAVFKGYGIEPGVTPPVEAAGRINGSLVRERLLASLELWFVLAGRPPAVGAILAAADPDDFRNEVRATDYQRATFTRAFRDRPLPPAPPVWHAVAHAEDRAVGREGRKQLLLAAHAARPNNFTLLMALGAIDLESRASIVKDSAVATAGWYRSALALRPRNAVAWNNLGNALRRAGDTAGARAAFREVLSLNPKNPMAHTNMGLTLDAEGDLTGAIDWYRKAVALAPDDPEAWVVLGIGLMEVGDRPGALVAQEKATAADKTYAPAHTLRGTLLGPGGNWRAAAEAYKEAIRLDPESPMAPFRELAVAYGKIGDHKAAVPARREVVKRRPDDPTVHDDLGNALRKAGDARGAVAAHREAIRLNPKSGSSYVYLSQALKDLGQNTEELAVLQTAVKVAPDDPDTWTNLGAVLYEAGELRAALTTLQKAVEVGPNHAMAHTNLGLVLRATGDSKGAIAAQRKATDLDPKCTQAWTNLAVALGASGDNKGAIAAARRAIDLDPEDPYGHATLGLALKGVGDIPGARKAFTEAARLNPKRFGVLLKSLPKDD